LETRDVSNSRAKGGVAASTSWGEPGSALIERFGTSVMLLLRPLDFDDSYTKVVVRDVAVGGVPLIAFFQMDKTTGGLKRMQLKRQCHGVNPPAFRGVVVGLEGVFGAPDTTCAIAPGTMSGYQALRARGGLGVSASPHGPSAITQPTAAIDPANSRP
jgi:hypothetical protein